MHEFSRCCSITDCGRKRLGFWIVPKKRTEFVDFWNILCADSGSKEIKGNYEEGVDAYNTFIIGNF